MSPFALRPPVQSDRACSRTGNPTLEKKSARSSMVIDGRVASIEFRLCINPGCTPRTACLSSADPRLHLVTGVNPVAELLVGHVQDLPTTEALLRFGKRLGHCLSARTVAFSRHERTGHYRPKTFLSARLQRLVPRPVSEQMSTIAIDVAQSYREQQQWANQFR